jgi:hypothetical protein
MIGASVRIGTAHKTMALRQPSVRALLTVNVWKGPGLTPAFKP